MANDKEDSGLSKMMQEYKNTKEKYSDCIVFCRLGDFYEMFYEDAIICSKELDLALTSKNCGNNQRAPMCGIPYHAADAYLPKLISKGYKVAIYEQLSTPVKGKLVERDVIRVITPGMAIESNILDEKKNNYVLSLYCMVDYAALSYVDISTGEFYAVDFPKKEYINTLNDELLRIAPSEIITNSYSSKLIPQIPGLITGSIPSFSQFYDWAYDKNLGEKNIKKLYGVKTLKSFDIDEKDAIICATGALLEYISQTQKRNLDYLKPIKLIQSTDYLYLDANARRNLELTSSIRENKRKGSLLDILDYTNTPMGARLLRTSIEQPLQNETEINSRLDAVAELCSNLIIRDALKEQLHGIYDIERCCSKISYNSVTPNDCNSLKDAIMRLTKVKKIISSLKCKKLANIFNDIDNYDELYAKLDAAINPDAKSFEHASGYIRFGYNAELDNYKYIKTNGADKIFALEKKERELTGINNLKIKFNNVFGYTIEVSKTQVDKVPIRYIRRQTLANGERYITDELKTLESQILNASDYITKIESKLYKEIVELLKTYIPSILNTSKSIAELDMLLSFAIVAIKHNYTRPVISTKLENLVIEGGRHPVVEALLNGEMFVPNDTFLNSSTDRIMIITGPNMAGKSTYMRQNALIVLMAHLGSFVPASHAEIPIIDRIFTRVGASDDLAFGQSTFMVEMSEVSNILNNATNKSLIILDEVGRGTATYDGLSIAWSIMEYISNNLKAKTLFATHYHELSDLEGILDGVKNYCIKVKELNDGIVFLRKIVRGSANKSFGIEVASLAGIPKLVITRAKEILKTLESNEKINITNVCQNILTEEYNMQQDNSQQIIQILNEIKINEVTPFMAMEILYNMKSIIGKENI